MNFLETLKSIGGVKPCQGCLSGVLNSAMPNAKVSKSTCEICHGTGQILDLAPLLAKPKELAPFVGLALVELFKAEGLTGFVGDKREIPTDKDYFVVGPQRAHSLIYEVARQLGGTAVVIIEQYRKSHVTWEDASEDDIFYEDGYRLSLPIPPDATVLFVTDRITKDDYNYAVFRAVESTGHDPMKILPYILCLVNGYGEDKVSYGMNVISLHSAVCEVHPCTACRVHSQGVRGERTITK